MAVTSSISCILATSLVAVVFTGMQIYKTLLSSSQLMTIFGGYIGSILFLLTLTAIGNLETSLFGYSFQTKLFPEVVLCLVFAMVASGMVHNVCITTCFIFSLVALYYISRISQNRYAPPQQTFASVTHKTKRNK